jgi:transportin-3
VDEFAGPEDLAGASHEQQEEIVSGLIGMLNAFCMATFTVLTSSTHLRNHPDTIDDFFRLCTRFLQKRPEKFLTESMLDPILNLTIAAMQLDHREANNSVTKFLVELIESSKASSSSLAAKAIISKILSDKIGQDLMNTVINCALFNLPSYFVPDMADILWQLITWDRNAVKTWLGVTLKTVPTQNQAGVVAATPDQLREFYNNVSDANNPKFVAQSLRYLSRLYR